MKKEEEEKFNKRFRRIAFVILILAVLTIPFTLMVRKISYNGYLSTVATYGTDSEEVKNYFVFNTPDIIWLINEILCIASVCSLTIFYMTKRIINSKKGSNAKEKLVRNWPCLLLAFFMVWTAVGCIQAGMEMDAEIIVRQAKDISTVPQRIIDIANWSSGDRMSNTSNIYQNAKSRAWNGCENLKDGYFSFIFYATILLDVLMLGLSSEKYKKWILRTLLVSSAIVGFLTILSFFRPIPFNGIIYFQRSMFNNSNHLGYYISVIAIFSAVMWIREDNYYFKGLHLLNTIMYFFLLIINNTFGAYLGVLCGMIYLLIAEIIRFVKNRNKHELLQYGVVLLIFLTSSLTIAGADSKNYVVNHTYFSYANLYLNLGEATRHFTFNSMTQEMAESFGISEATIDKNKIRWGNTNEILEDKMKTIVERNFDGLFNDIKTLANDKSKEAPVSGETEQNTITQDELTNMLLAVDKKYPKVSGESEEEFNERQAKIEAEYQEIMSKYSASTANKSGLSEEVSMIGSGRGETWIRVLDLVNQRPWFGWGLENLLNEFYQQYGIKEGRTHNLVLQLAGTVGIPGVIMYLVATISIFLKNIFDAKFRKYSKKQLLIIFGIMVASAIATALIVGHFTDKLLFIWGAITIVETLVVLIAFTNKVKFRVPSWNVFEHVGTAVFVSYMISSLFGNSAFYTSPYFMIFLGLITYEMLNKKSLITEAEALESTSKNKENTGAESTDDTKVVTEKKEASKKNKKKRGK